MILPHLSPLEATFRAKMGHRLSARVQTGPPNVVSVRPAVYRMGWPDIPRFVSASSGTPQLPRSGFLPPASLPKVGHRRPAEELRNPRPRRIRGTIGQMFRIEPVHRLDLASRTAFTRLPVANHTHHDMITAKASVIGMHALDRCLAADIDTGLVTQFMGKGIPHGLAFFNAAAGQMPTANIGVAHQNDVSVGAYDDAANTQRRTP